MRFRYWVIGIITGPLVFGLLLLCTAWLWLPFLGSWLLLPSQTVQKGRADVIVVLGGGGPERLMQGIELYKQGLAPQLWVTGDMPFSQMTNFTEGELAQRFAIEQGVPFGSIRLLATTSTWKDGQEIAAALQRMGARQVLVVTSWYHSRRAVCVLKRHLAGTQIVVFYHAPPIHTAGPEYWWQQEEGLVNVINEWFKFGLYWAKYGLGPFEC